MRIDQGRLDGTAQGCHCNERKSSTDHVLTEKQGNDMFACLACLNGLYLIPQHKSRAMSIWFAASTEKSVAFITASALSRIKMQRQAIGQPIREVGAEQTPPGCHLPVISSL